MATCQTNIECLETLVQVLRHGSLTDVNNMVTQLHILTGIQSLMTINMQLIPHPSRSITNGICIDHDAVLYLHAALWLIDEQSDATVLVKYNKKSPHIDIVGRRSPICRENNFWRPDLMRLMLIVCFDACAIVLTTFVTEFGSRQL